MAYQTPKTDWTPVDGVTDADLNRIEGNIDITHNLRITNDAGGVLLTAPNTTDDILSMIANSGQGIYTFYAAGTSLNVPSGKSIRGIAHITSVNPAFGWVYATDFDNKIFTNYIDNGTWKGWAPLLEDVGNTDFLWNGNQFPLAAVTITPTKKLSECNNGWVLVFSDVDGTTSNNYNWCTVYIPKYMGKNMAGANWTLILSGGSTTGTVSTPVSKILVVWDNKITGDDTNNQGAAADVTLRLVLEY